MTLVHDAGISGFMFSEGSLFSATTVEWTRKNGHGFAARGAYQDINPKLPSCYTIALLGSRIRNVSTRTCNLLSDVHQWQKTDSWVSLCDDRKERYSLTLYRFDTVSSGAGENAKLIYVNWQNHLSQRNHAADSQWTHKWITSLPSKFLPQELNDSLEAIGSCYLVEVRLHDWSVSNCFEAHNNCSLWHWDYDHYSQCLWWYGCMITFWRILFLVRVQCLQGLGDALTAFWGWYRAAVNIWATWGQRHACVWYKAIVVWKLVTNGHIGPN